MRLEDVTVKLLMSYEVDGDVIKVLKASGLTTDDITKELVEPYSYKIKNALEVDLHCLRRDYSYAITSTSIDVNYPLTTIRLDVELDENDYDTPEESKEMFLINLKQALTSDSHRVYITYGRRNDLTTMVVSFELLDDIMIIREDGRRIC